MQEWQPQARRAGRGGLYSAAGNHGQLRLPSEGVRFISPKITLVAVLPIV